MQFLDVIIRQAHPGEQRAAYNSDSEKQASAEEYRRMEHLPWPVLVDDLPGTVHQAYGNMPDPVYLIDADGRVAFYGMWTHPPTLQQAIEELLAQGGRGVVLGDGIDHVVHLLGSFVGGWQGLRRGGWQAVFDYELGSPPAASLTFLGSLLRPILAPLALRATPLPTSTRIGLAAALLAALLFGLRQRE